MHKMLLGGIITSAIIPDNVKITPHIFNFSCVKAAVWCNAIILE